MGLRVEVHWAHNVVGQLSEHSFALFLRKRAHVELSKMYAKEKAVGQEEGHTDRWRRSLETVSQGPKSCRSGRPI